MPQIDERRDQAANQLIEQLMKVALTLSPGATRVRLARVQAAPSRYSVTNSVAVRGRALGPTPRDRPLSDWSAFLPALLAGRCTMDLLPRNSLDGGVAAMRCRIPSNRMINALACPAAGPDGIEAALFILWDGIERPPVVLSDLIAPARSALRSILNVWDLCGDREPAVGLRLAA